jgi:phage shock protein PspC (stress-responsive transcriptional regulator)
MFKNILGYIKLQLSFLGWWLLTLLIYISVSMIIPNQSSVLIKLISDISGVFMFGVGFYFYPYYNTSLAIYAKQLLESE